MNLTLFREPSTWAGVAVLLSLFGVQIAPTEVAQIGAGAAAVASIFLRENRV